MNKTKVLVTGASGFLGSSFVAKYAGNLNILGTGRRKMDVSGYFSHDLSQPLDIDFEPEVVVHAAARASFWGKKADFERDNVEATRNVIAFCEQKNVKKLIYISSSSVFYNGTDQLDMTEETPIGPDFINDYARTKYEGEKLVGQFQGQWAVLRPRAIFGPGDTVLFPRILETAKKGALPILDRKGYQAIGDIIYIENMVDYIFKVVVDPEIIGAFNLTNNQPVEIQPFVHGLLKSLQLPVPMRKVSFQKALFMAGVVERIYKLFYPAKEPPISRFGIQVFGLSKTFDVSKSLQYLGEPNIDLKEGVTRFVKWQEEQQT